MPTLQGLIGRLQGLGRALSQYGTQLLLCLGVLVGGLLLARLVARTLQRILPQTRTSRLFCNILHVLMVVIVVTAATMELGATPANVFRLSGIVALLAIGLVVFLRPFLPTMPFKAGNFIKAGNLLGIVEAVTFLNTRMMTFDGTTIFVPNRKILDDIVINYHYTQTRRVTIDVGIHYEEDIHKAKRVLLAVMNGHDGVKEMPAPIVYVLNLADSCVELEARCWVDNFDYWEVRCDLLEKIKLRFDDEGLRFAYPQMELHVSAKQAKIAARDDGAGTERVGSP